MTDFLVYDVFTDKAFGGNQLAVIPDASALPEDDLQRIAREFNFSETTFVYPPSDPANTAKLRIFTPTKEVPFAGHPIIGTVAALHDLGGADTMILELGIGPLSCVVNDGEVSFTTEAKLVVLGTPGLTLVAKSLGINTDDISLQWHPPTLATLGLPFTITEVTTREALRNALPNTDAMREGLADFPESEDFAQFIYFTEGDTLHARMFAPLDNIPEDPATGSASATLGALLREVTGLDQTLTVRQGEDMGRPSVINLRTHGSRVSIIGSAKRTMQGELVYSAS